MPGIEFLLGHSEQAFDAEGNLVYEEKVKELEENFAEFQEFVTITNQLVSQSNTERKRNFSWELEDKEVK
ncbi:Uncharacterised protein [Streptococcus constellatus]|uniref:Uncharacterized protein n=1 Tax=Streptococcus constellatus TaxID=76860 RepID=A0A564TGR0_STRCV|nr:Uncharacterised protein [Streptococcus constellatus]VUX09913.1 Uncharacterised protein [Streptococcus gordonii]